MTTTPTGVELDTADTAENAFLNRWQDAGMLSGSDEGANDEDKDGDEITPEPQSTDETQDDFEDLELEEQGEEEDEQEEDGDDQNKVEASDDAVVKIKIGDESRTVAVKDLKRLYGQEAALTRKSQEVAQARTKAEEEGTLYMAASQRMIEKAQQKFEPYKNIDWLVASKQLTTSEFSALRQEAQQVYSEIQFLEQEADSVLQTVQAQRNVEMAEAAKECIKELSEKIPNWSEQRYNNLRDFTATRGMSTEMFNSIVDPVALSIINDALTLQEARKRAEAKKVAAPTAKRVMKNSKGRSSAAGVAPNKTAALAARQKLARSGSDEDAQNAFMSAWTDEG